MCTLSLDQQLTSELRQIPIKLEQLSTSQTEQNNVWKMNMKLTCYLGRCQIHSDSLPLKKQKKSMNMASTPLKVVTTLNPQKIDHLAGLSS